MPTRSTRRTWAEVGLAGVARPADRVTLTAVAHYADGTRRDVTPLAAFETTTIGVAKVLPSGEVVKEADGETVVLVRYLGVQAPVRLAFLPARPPLDLSATPTPHPIDRHVFRQLTALRIEPSAVCADEVFARRAFLDACADPAGVARLRELVAPYRAERAAEICGVPIGDLDPALSVFQEAAELARECKNPVIRARAEVGTNLWANAFVPDLPRMRRLEDALETLPPGEPHLRAALLGRLTIVGGADVDATDRVRDRRGRLASGADTRW